MFQVTTVLPEPNAPISKIPTISSQPEKSKKEKKDAKKDAKKEEGKTDE